MAKSKRMCLGCRDDYYNQTRDGGCWMYPKAKIVARVSVGTWQPPPYVWCPQKIFDCHHREGASWLKREDERVVKDIAAAEAWRKRIAKVG